jgi:hypothetical protein
VAFPCFRLFVCSGRCLRLPLPAPAKEPHETAVGDAMHTACPLWVISGHGDNAARCPLFPRKRTSIVSIEKEGSSSTIRPTVEIWAPEETLRTTKMARKRGQSNALIESADPYAKPAFIGAAHVRCDDTCLSYLEADWRFRMDYPRRGPTAKNFM